MVAITITPGAFAVIASILPKGYTAAGRADDRGGYLVTLDTGARDRAKACRRRRETYSDVIFRLATG